jgi:hypothetical protein
MIPQPASTQLAEFAFRTLPDLFHQAPDQFLQILELEGNKFLKFYWVETAKRLKLPTDTVPYGLDFAVQHATSLLTAAWITFPKPTQSGEAFLGAFIFRPTRVAKIPGVQDVSKVLLLVNQADLPAESGFPVVEVSRRNEIYQIIQGIQPQRTAFHDAVSYILKNNL